MKIRIWEISDVCIRLMRTWRARVCGAIRSSRYWAYNLSRSKIPKVRSLRIAHTIFDATTGHRDCEADVLLPAIDATIDVVTNMSGHQLSGWIVDRKMAGK
ncbi:MAG: hypothetical protein IPI30_22720 [Saprospiraceae bacterium]|nr:hypothetical protein [Candidatus Vicinibacter affinis]